MKCGLFLNANPNLNLYNKNIVQNTVLMEGNTVGIINLIFYEPILHRVSRKISIT